MKTFPTGFAAEIAKKRGAKPVWIYTLTVGGTAYYISDFSTTITGWQASPVTTLPWVSQWGQITEQISGSLNEIRIADFSLSLISDPDDANNINYLATNHNLEASPCSLYLWFLGLNATTGPPQEFFRGYVRDLATSDGGTTWTLTIEDEASRLTAYFGEILSPENYPDCIQAHVGRLLPIVFGTVQNVAPPVAQVTTGSPGNYYFMFGDVLDSITNVRFKKTDGTYQALTVGTGTNQYSFWTGKTGNVYGLCAGKAVIRTQAITTGTGTTTQQMTVEPYKLNKEGVWYYPGDNGAIDSNDSTYYGAMITTTYSPTYAFQQTNIINAFRARIKLTVNTTPVTITIIVKDPNGTIVKNQAMATPINQAWIDTGWTSCSSLTGTWTIAIASSYNGTNINLYAGHLDFQTVVTSYTDAPSLLVADCTRVVGASNAPDDVATVLATIPVDSIKILRPNSAPSLLNYATITNEPNQRDGDLSTFSTWTRTSGTLAPGCSYTSIPVITGSPQLFRVGAKLSCNQSAIYAMQLNCFFGYSSSSVNIMGNMSADTIYGPWTPITAAFDSINLHFVDPNISGISIYDIWVEVKTVTRTSTYTVNGTWTSSPSGYQANGVVADSKRIIDWLDYFSFQFRCWFKIQCGTAKMIFRDDVLVPVAAISAVASSGGKSEWSRKRAPKTDVINTINISYARDYSQSSATYTRMSKNQDGQSITDFGQLSNDGLFKCDFVSSDQHASSLRDFYLDKLSYRYWLEDLTVFLDNIMLEFGDVVTLPDGRIGTVVSVGIQPGSIDAMDKINLTVMV